MYPWPLLRIRGGRSSEAIKLLELCCKRFVPRKTTAVERLPVLREPVVERIHCSTTILGNILSAFVCNGRISY